MSDPEGMAQSDEMSQSTSSGAIESWISTFCSLMGHEYFAEVSEDFIEDDFNLTGLQSQVPMYKEALEMILDVEPSEDGTDEGSEGEEEDEEAEDESEGQLGEELDEPNGKKVQRHGRSSSDASVIESSAELLYGLIHARYITSRPGIQQMMEKYELSHFGFCPRVYCNGVKVLPVGRTDTPGQETVKLFCPSCLDAYTPPNSRFQAVDGAFFGTTFPCLFLMTFPELEIAPTKKRSRDNALNGQQDDDSVLSPTDSSTLMSPQGSGMTASRSSSLTLPNAPPLPGLQTKDERAAAHAALLASLPPQPTSINGVTVSNLAPGLGRGKIYEPKIYGFRVSERARGGPRMKWLRSKPLDVNELDEARIWHERYGGNIDGDPGDEADEEDGEMEDEDGGEAGDQIDEETRMVVQEKRGGRGKRKGAINGNGNGTTSAASRRSRNGGVGVPGGG